MQRVVASAQKISVANKRVHGRCARRNVVIVSKMDHRPNGPRVDTATKAVWACVASLLLSIEAPSPALADAPPAGSSQGAVLEELLKQQQEGKVKAITLKAAKTSAPVPAYEQAKSASKSTANKSTAASSQKSQKQPSVSKKNVQTQVLQSKQGSRSLKFDGKATAGTQGSAPTGLELPVPKALAKSKVAPSTQTSSTTKRQELKAKPAPATSKKPTIPKPAATAAQQKKPVAAPVPVAPVPSPAPATTVPTSAITSPLSNDVIQAGAVLTAEVLGLVIASAIVGQLTKPVKALKTTRA